MVKDSRDDPEAEAAKEEVRQELTPLHDPQDHTDIAEAAIKARQHRGKHGQTPVTGKQDGKKRR